MALEYRRTIVLTTVPVTGYFKFDKKFQILPIEEKAPKVAYLRCHHPLIIEYSFEIDETPQTLINGENIDQWVINNDTSSQILKELLLLLSTFSFYHVFMYNNAKSWFIPHCNSAKNKEIIWGQQAYYYENFNSEITKFSEINYPHIKKISSNDYFNRLGLFPDQEFDLPNNIDQLFAQYYQLSAQAKKAFLSSASLLTQGLKLWTEHPSLSFTAFVSSLETLISYEHRKIKIEKCQACGQDKYGVVNKFRDFFLKYGSSNPIFKKYALKIYKYRSKIVHSGELLLGEISLLKFGSLDGLEENELRENLFLTCRICLINWLMTQKT